MIIMGFAVPKTQLNGSPHLVCPFEQCEMKFSSYSGIQKHIKIHLGIIISQSFVPDPEMKVELKNKSKVYSCEICDKTFDKKKRLLTHVEKFHTFTEKVEPKDIKIINGKTFFICPHEGCRKIYTTVGFI
uniref:C2H2-type domain-containing protein n=1 Tax=Theileria parva TaxID=5875 RepID=Q4MYV8_THEPA|eukprot:XP_762857.1 hypothetical protein [Theileria parva strain Muguga]